RLVLDAGAGVEAGDVGPGLLRPQGQSERAAQGAESDDAGAHAALSLPSAALPPLGARLVGLRRRGETIAEAADRGDVLGRPVGVLQLLAQATDVDIDGARLAQEFV